MNRIPPVNLRFTVGSAAVGRGFVWRAFSNPNKDDVYLKISDFKGKRGSKFSFHKERLRYALLDTPSHWPSERDRAIFKWNRKAISPIGSHHFTPVFQLEVPTDYLNPFHRPDKPTIFIPPAPAGHGVVVIGGYTMEPREVIEANLPPQARLIAYSSLPKDASFLIISFEAPSNNLDLVTENAVFDAKQNKDTRRTRIILCGEADSEEGFVRITELGGIVGAPLPNGNFFRLSRDEVFESYSV